MSRWQRLASWMGLAPLRWPEGTPLMNGDFQWGTLQPGWDFTPLPICTRCQQAIWNPPETAPKDGNAFLITTAGPNMDICWWDGLCFRDYHFKQPIAPLWPYMIGWAPMPAPAKIKDTEAETRAANGWKPPVKAESA